MVIGPDGKPVKRVNCGKIMRRADQEIIKPLLIYNYESKAHRRQKEFFELMMKQGVHLEEAYVGTKNAEDNTDRKSHIIGILNKASNFNQESDNYRISLAKQADGAEGVPS